ncbi:F-box/WD-40 repeat-containing protein At3g52030 [Apium graveolens]|uniref:F-box/WD-40 repeat-containing protein At3g52030 n=1 Tax=Apium graveolens TaxID=4045 RepID=UPI003D7A2C81
MGLDASSSAVQPPAKKRILKYPASAQLSDLTDDTLSLIFSFLDFIDLLYCSAVCKSWNCVISTSKLFQTLYYKHKRCQSINLLEESDCSENTSKIFLKELALDSHRTALQEGSVDIYQWKGHLAWVNQCRMKMGLVLTGGNDKVMRLWSVNNYKCLEEYSVPDRARLIDFDFDESKIVSLVGTTLGIWRRNGRRNIFLSREGEIPKASCMCYVDPEAVVGCEDGRARILDMYSRKWSKILKIHDWPVTCISLTDTQMIVGGSSIGNITVSDFSSAQRVATLKSLGSAGISTLCVNPGSPLIFSGSTAGQACCWDLRTMRSVWQKRVSPNVIYSMNHLRDHPSVLVMGGIDGVLRAVDETSGKILSSCILNQDTSGSKRAEASNKLSRKKGSRITEDTRLELMPKALRPSITSLAVGFRKVVTIHDDNYIRVWKFRI